MKTIYVAAVSGISLFCGCPVAFSGQEVALVSDISYPPYSYNEGATAVGIYPEILRRVFAQMSEYNVTITPMPWKRALQMAENGDALGVVPPYYRKELRPWMGYSDPIFEEKIVVVCDKAVAEKVAGKAYPADYAGLTFGNLAGSRAGGEALHTMADKGQLKIEEAKTTDQNLMKMAAGRIDCYVDDANAVESAWNKLAKANAKLQRNFERVADVSVEKTYIGLTGSGKFPFMADFIKEFNARLAELKARGEIDRIVQEALK